MISFKKYITEDESLVNPRLLTPSLKSRYHKFNIELFNNKLPEIPVEFKALKKTVRGEAIVRYNKKTNEIVTGSLMIYITPTIKMNDSILNGILVHEMIHVYEYVTGRLHRGHDSFFSAKVDELQKKVDFNIMPAVYRNDDVEFSGEAKAREVLCLVIRRKTGNSIYILFRPAVSVDLLKDYGLRWKKSDEDIVEIYKGSTQLASEVTVRNGINRGISAYIITPEIDQKIIKDLKKLD